MPSRVRKIRRVMLLPGPARGCCAADSPGMKRGSERESEGKREREIERERDTASQREKERERER